MRLILLPVLLLAAPIAEIAVFILVGREIGVLPTLGLVLLGAVLGLLLLSRGGIGALRRIQAELRAGGDPGRELVHGAMILTAGLLLLVPGFISDALGLLLLLPPVRDRAWNGLRGRVVVAGSATRGGARAGPARPAAGDRRTIDLADADFQRKADPASPWTGRSPPDDDAPTLH